MSYKIVNGKIAVNIPEYIGGPTRVTRSYHSCKYNNFFTRTRKEWNTLPSFLLDQPSVDAFKSAQLRIILVSLTEIIYYYRQLYI